jgi:hypothetical protein
MTHCSSRNLALVFDVAAVVGCAAWASVAWPQDQQLAPEGRGLLPGQTYSLSAPTVTGGSVFEGKTTKPIAVASKKTAIATHGHKVRKCLMQVDGKSYIKGPCNFVGHREDGGFSIEELDNDRIDRGHWPWSATRRLMLGECPRKGLRLEIRRL